MYRYYLLLKRFWWVLIITVIGGLSWKFYQIDQKPDEYVSQARMMVSARLKIPEGVSYSEELANFFGTQIEIMKSSEVLENARERVLRENPLIKDNQFAFVSASQIPNTSIFELSSRGIDVEYTRLYLNSIMEEFISFKRDKRQETSLSTISQLTTELARLRKEQEQEQRALYEFKQKYNIPYWEAQIESGAKFLSELKDQESRLKTRIRFLESLIHSGEGDDLKDIDLSQIASSGVLDELPVSEIFRDEYFVTQKKLLKAQIILEDYLQVLTLRHPKVMAVTEEINRLETFVDLLLFRNLEVAKSNINILKKELFTIQESISEMEESVLESSKIQSEYELIQVSLDRSKVLYANLMSSIQRLEISENINVETIQILQVANPATKASPGWISGLLEGALLGFMVGAAFIVLVDVLDDRIVSSIDVQSGFSAPLLTQIPVVNQENADEDLILQLDEHRLPFSEAFRNLRSSIIFRQESQQVKSIIITSTLPNEGKSTVSANLAITMAQTGERILIIDGDLRRGSLTKIFDAKSQKGLTESVEDIDAWGDYVLKTDYPNLFLLPLGQQPSQPGELFLKPALDALLEDAKNKYDRIIFDSAPILAVTDSASLAPKLDAVLMVMRSGVTSQQKAKQAIHALESRQANIFGLVMNGVEPMAPGYGYYKYKSYYY